jgi:hypothetical protein
MLKIGMAVTAFLVVLASCAKQSALPADAPRGTVIMRDGTRLPGKILENSAAEVKVVGDDNITRAIPMGQVRAVDYGDVPAAPLTATPPAAPDNPAPAAPASAPAPRQAPPAEPYEPAHEAHYHPPAAAVTTKTYEVPSGTEVSVRNEETIDSAKAVTGQTYAAEVTRDIRDAAGDVVIPRGSNAQIIIRSASGGGKLKGAADLVLDLASVSIEGRRYELETVDIVEKGHDNVGVNKRTAKFTGGGAALGAIIGAIAGGGKGAAIGAGSGAGAGALTQVLTKGGSIKVPVETVLTFKLEQPLRVRASE